MIRAERADDAWVSPACDYCGLPTRGTARVADQPLFCCLGCKLAASITADNSDSNAGVSRTALQLGLAVFFSMNVMVFTLALWSWDTYTIATSENAAILKDLLRLACLLFATPVVVILGTPLITNVLSQLRGGIITADSLLVVGVVAAFGYSIVSVLTGQEHIYFEVACMILVAVTLGRWLEAEGKHRAMKSLQTLQNLLPETARVVGADGVLTPTPLAEVAVGQMIRVLPGERVPLDGTIRVGQSYVDQQLVTGESCAVCRSSGDRVFGGTSNLDGRLDIRVDSTAASGIVQRLVASVKEAASRASRPQRLADRLATVFVPLVFLVATTVFFVHWKATDLHHALMASMAVALIACPCALAIATPLAVWAALGNAAKHGIVFRTSDDLTKLSEVNVLCIDKTGTLTTDRPQLAGAWYCPGSEDDARSVAQRLAVQTLHPLAIALGEQLQNDRVDHPWKLGPATTTPGKGVSTTLSTPEWGQRLMATLGSAEFCIDQGLRCDPELQHARDRALAAGQSVVCVGWDSNVRGVFAFEESLRPDAITAVRGLKGLALRTVLLTGDQPERAGRIASTLELDAASQLLPGDKQAIIHELQEDGHRVAMLGDGLNDAPALSTADVGIATGMRGGGNKGRRRRVSVVFGTWITAVGICPISRHATYDSPQSGLGSGL